MRMLPEMYSVHPVQKSYHKRKRPVNERRGEAQLFLKLIPAAVSGNRLRRESNKVQEMLFKAVQQESPAGYFAAAFLKAEGNTLRAAAAPGRKDPQQLVYTL